MVWDWSEGEGGLIFCLLKKTNPLKGDISHRNITSSKPATELIFFQRKISPKLSLNRVQDLLKPQEVHLPTYHPGETIRLKLHFA